MPPKKPSIKRADVDATVLSRVQQYATLPEGEVISTRSELTRLQIDAVLVLKIMMDMEVQYPQLQCADEESAFERDEPLMEVKTVAALQDIIWQCLQNALKPTSKKSQKNPTHLYQSLEYHMLEGSTRSKICIKQFGDKLLSCLASYVKAESAKDITMEMDRLKLDLSDLDIIELVLEMEDAYPLLKLDDPREKVEKKERDQALLTAKTIGNIRDLLWHSLTQLMVRKG